MKTSIVHVIRPILELLVTRVASKSPVDITPCDEVLMEYFVLPLCPEQLARARAGLRPRCGGASPSAVEEHVQPAERPQGLQGGDAQPGAVRGVQGAVCPLSIRC